MERKSIKKLREVLEVKIEYVKETIAAYKGNENTQVKEMHIAAKAELDAYENVMQYLENGSTMFLK